MPANFLELFPFVANSSCDSFVFAHESNCGELLPEDLEDFFWLEGFLELHVEPNPPVSSMPGKKGACGRGEREEKKDGTDDMADSATDP